MSTYKRMDVVRVQDNYDKDQWHFGIVDHDFNEGDLWVQATLKEDDGCSTSMRVPGYEPKEVRLATEDELAAAPAFVHAFLKERRDREEERLLNKRDPHVTHSNRKGLASLRAAGIYRQSDLARFSDKELLAMPGIGKKWVDNIRFLVAGNAERQAVQS